MISITLKVFAVIVALFLFIIVGGLSGSFFKIWPTFLADKNLQITAKTLNELRTLKKTPKFLPDQEKFYFGAPSEKVRSEAESKINELIELLIKGLPQNPKKSFVLQEFKKSLPSFDEYDTEERDQALLYFDKIMEITNTTESNEILNVWRYGLPFGWFSQKA